MAGVWVVSSKTRGGVQAAFLQMRLQAVVANAALFDASEVAFAVRLHQHHHYFLNLPKTVLYGTVSLRCPPGCQGEDPLLWSPGNPAWEDGSQETKCSRTETLRATSPLQTCYLELGKISGEEKVAS